MRHLFTFLLLFGIVLFVTGAPVAGHMKGTHGVGLSLIEWVGAISALIGLSEKVIKFTLWLVKQGEK